MARLPGTLRGNFEALTKGDAAILNEELIEAAKPCVISK